MGSSSSLFAGEVAQFVETHGTGALSFGDAKQKQNSLIVRSVTSPRGPCIVVVSTTSALLNWETDGDRFGDF